MSVIYLISIEQLKRDTIIQDNVDPKGIEPVIREMQDVYIHPLLGTALYEDLLSELDADITLAGNAAYKTLLDSYIQPCLRQYILADVMITNTYKVANKAVLTKTSDNSNPAPLSELRRLRDDVINKAEWYAERCTKYLYANNTTYPLFLTQDRIDAIYPNGTNYKTGIYLGNRYDELPPWKARQ